jgi:hypothetical protein
MIENKNDINNILEKIDFFSNKILHKLDTLELRITNLENRLGYSNLHLKNENLKELKNEQLTMDSNDVRKALQYRDFRSVIYVFKKIYKNEENGSYKYPIRITGKRSYDYYYNSQWIPDLYGHHITNVITYNVQNLFLKNNNLDQFDRESFIMNQQFIYKLRDEKYKREICKHIIEEIRIHSFSLT